MLFALGLLSIITGISAGPIIPIELIPSTSSSSPTELPKNLNLTIGLHVSNSSSTKPLITSSSVGTTLSSTQQYLATSESLLSSRNNHSVISTTTPQSRPILKT